MDIKRAVQILTTLADGVDPYTGEVLPNQSPYQQIETVRALFSAIKALQNTHLPKKQLQNAPSNAGQPWSEVENNELAKGFEEQLSIKELSEKHGRTRGAITARLKHIGKIQV